MTEYTNESELHKSKNIGSYGPWSASCDHVERQCQLRTLAAIAHLQLGSRHPLITELRAAETERLAFVRAQELIDELPALARRHLLAAFCAVTWPPRPKAGGAR